jgi:hypothetical protein
MKNNTINRQLLARLDTAKKAAAASQYRPNWKDHRPAGPLLKGYPGTRGDNGVIYVASLTDEIFWKTEGDADKHARNVNSWYTDQFQENAVTPAVVSIRNPKELNSDGSHKVFFAATYYSEWDGATIYTRHSYDDAREAALAAESEAESEAERARDDAAKDTAECQIEDARAEIHALNKQALELIREIKHKDYAPPVCAAIRSQLSDFLQERRRAFERIEKLQDNYWYSVGH